MVNNLLYIIIIIIIIIWLHITIFFKKNYDDGKFLLYLII